MDGPTNINRGASASIGGALSVLLIWGLRDGLGIMPPDEAVIAITVVIGSLVSAIYSRFGGL